ncbi:hypothetical protein EYR36_005108 [Pleurotus pulmonarius]|nr:hypothetical protein EYR36_005108 [Pleurotus pulmonarius]
MSEYLLAFKAGRAFRNEGTNRVEPSPTKGAIILTNGDDGLLHFIWKNRSTNQIEEDLILFPTDASFVKVSQATSGRIYVLKFSSSNQRHFDASDERDAKFVENLNGLLQDPEYTLDWSSEATTSAQASTSQVPQATPEQLAQIQRIVQSMSGTTQPPSPELSLTDILTSDNLRPLFTSHPELIPALFPHLPPDLPIPPSTEVLERVIRSPQFRASVASFDQALRTGLLGGLVRGLGLPEEAGTSVEAFLRAIQEQADRGDSMETD